jgi:exosortase/archaeosortase family protein
LAGESNGKILQHAGWSYSNALARGTAAAILILLPDPTSSTFWLQRIDLLTLPLFVSGLVALLFGLRRVWSLKAPIAFLLFAWPLPYTLFLSGATGQFTEFTASLVAEFTRLAPIAHPAPGDDTIFFIGSGVKTFSFSIGSACAGVNSFVGFLLIGTALLFVVRGPIIRRIAWLAVAIPVSFVFFHVVINESYAYESALQQSSVQVLFGLCLLCVVLAGGLWLACRLWLPKRRLSTTGHA